MLAKKTWLRPFKVAKRLDCSPDHVHNLIKAGELQAIQIGPRSYIISEESLETYLVKNMVLPTEKN